MTALCIGYLVAMVQRYSFSYAAPSLLSEGILTAYWQVGFVSATMVYLGYAPFQTLAGVMADKTSSKRLVYGSIAVSTVLSYLTGLVQNFLQVSLVRLAMGASQMGTWVPPMKILSRWFGAKRRSFAFSMLNASGAAATVVMGLVMPLLVFSYGWRMVFFLPAAVGLLVLPVVYLYVKDEPRDVKGAEVIGGAPSQESSERRLPVSFALRNKYVLALTMGLLLTAVMYQGLSFYGYPYLVSLMPPLEAGIATSVMALGRVVGTPFGGIFADRFGRGRFLAVTSIVLIPLIYLFSTLSSGTSFLVMPTLLIYGLVASMQLPALMGLSLEVAPSELAGTIIAIINLGASIGIFASAPVFGYLVDLAGGSFFSAWIFGLTCYAGGSLCYLYVYLSNRRRAAR